LDQDSIDGSNQSAGNTQETQARPRTDASAVLRPLAFPSFGHLRLHAAARSANSPDVAPSPLPQEADSRITPQDDRQTSSTKTPLGSNHFKIGAEFDVPSDVFMLVPLANIIVGDRLRGVVDAFVPIMANSVSERKFIQPPVVRPDPLGGDKFILVSGLQRINAATVLGMAAVLCRVTKLDDLEAALWEVDENLVRAALSPAEEALFMDRRRELYELMHGKSKAKGAMAANAAMGRQHAPAKLARASFAEDTAKRTGKSQRSIQRVVQRAAQNGRANLARVAGTALDRGAELDALPLLPPAARDRLIERATAGAKVSAVQAHKRMDEPPRETDTSPASYPRPQSPHSFDDTNDLLGLIALKSAWSEASALAREAFLSWIGTTDQT
jgi:ParB/RepB/Spo0J family partition protein